ncbi:YcxB family protein [Lachnospiraceae bacterium 50-23]|jgi:hypothetical protein|nr:YcxB family protein [Dorea sp.]
MPVKVEVKMDVPSMVDFMLYHIYTSRTGVLTIALGALNIGLTIAFAMKREFLYMVLFFMFAFVILGVFPYMIRIRVEKQMQHSRRLGIPVTYEFSDEGIVTMTPDDSGKASWKVFKRAVSRKRILILYDASKQAVILPVDQIPDTYTQIVDLIYKNMPAPAVRIHRLDRKKGF